MGGCPIKGVGHANPPIWLFARACRPVWVRSSERWREGHLCTVCWRNYKQLISTCNLPFCNRKPRFPPFPGLESPQLAYPLTNLPVFDTKWVWQAEKKFMTTIFVQDTLRNCLISNASPPMNLVVTEVWLIWNENTHLYGLLWMAELKLLSLSWEYLAIYWMR